MLSQTTPILPECPECLGEGDIMVPCPICDGSGKDPNTDEQCTYCDKSSNEVPEKCKACNGSRKMEESKLEEILENIKEMKEKIDYLLNEINDYISGDDLTDIKNIEYHLKEIIESSDFLELDILV